MLKQERVHHTAYMLSSEIDLSLLENDIFEVADLREGSELMSVSVTIEKVGTGKIDLGTTESKDYFLDNINLDTIATYRTKFETTLKTDTTLTLETTSRDGIIKIRVFYFTESKMYK